MNQSALPRLILITIIAVNILLGIGEVNARAQEDKPGGANEAAKIVPQEGLKESAKNPPAVDQLKKSDSTSLVAVGSTSTPSIDRIAGKQIRFHMWDGLIVGGDASIDAIDVETEFGSLKIPIEKILRFFPGLDSMPELQTRIERLVLDLGNREFEIREKSHNELLKMGNLLRHEIYRFEDGGSAERKKHLTELKKKIGELEDDLDDPVRPLIRGDYIETPNFSVVGRIVQREFRLNSQFGEMQVPLSQIKKGDRTFGLVAPVIRRSLDVDATVFFPEGINTKIRVSRGDRITISAQGDINWQNWNSSCDPEGMSDKGQFGSFRCGTLIARIGSDKYYKVGRNATFVAETGGELYLGIAMADNYRTGGYTWIGKYSAKILVKPQGNQ
jgi:hypothetical protein